MTDIEIVRATVRGVKDVVAFRVQLPSVKTPCWFTPIAVGPKGRSQECWHNNDHVTDRVPLRLVDESKEVVIDPEDWSLMVTFGHEKAERIQHYLRSMLKPVEPPIPPEPEGDNWIAIGLDNHSWSPSLVAKHGWAALWETYGPLTVYRREVT